MRGEEEDRLSRLTIHHPSLITPPEQPNPQGRDRLGKGRGWIQGQLDERGSPISWELGASFLRRIGGEDPPLLDLSRVPGGGVQKPSRQRRRGLISLSSAMKDYSSSHTVVLGERLLIQEPGWEVSDVHRGKVSKHPSLGCRYRASVIGTTDKSIHPLLRRHPTPRPPTISNHVVLSSSLVTGG